MERSSHRFKEDRISQLPNALICDILSHLPTKEVVRTSVLSTTWRSLWLCVPDLELESCKFTDLNAFVSFGDMFFDSSRVSCIDKVKLTIDENDDGVDDMSYIITSWIDAALKRKIQHLDVKCKGLDYHQEMPLTLYTCKTLVYLKLALVSFYDAEFVSLPCLETMHLEDNFYSNEATFERLISSCPVLEELKIVGCSNRNAKVFRVLSRSLKRLTISIWFSRKDIGSGVVIDAPRLHFLSINDNLPERFRITNMDSNAKFNISIAFPSKRNNIHHFFLGISKVRDMKVCSKTIKLINQYSKVEPLHQFGCVSHLRVTLCVFDLNWLPIFLGSYRNLKSLILNWEDDSKYLEVMNQMKFLYAPECLISSLEFVDFETSISGYASEMELVRYFLVNSAILKKLTLRVYDYSRLYDILGQLLKIPRSSIACQVIVSHGFDRFNM